MAYGIRDNNLLFFRKNGEPLNLPASIKILHEFEDGKTSTTHIYRHTFITRMIENNKPSKRIAVHVGHSDTQMIDRVYSHFSDKMDDDLRKHLTKHQYKLLPFC